MSKLPLCGGYNYLPNCDESFSQPAGKCYEDGGGKFCTVPVSWNFGLSGTDGGDSGEFQAEFGTVGKSPYPLGLGDNGGCASIFSDPIGSEG